jgi:hypothetical protein
MPSGTSKASSPSVASWALRTTICTGHIKMTRVSPRFVASSEEHAGMIDVGADSDPANR